MDREARSWLRTLKAQGEGLDAIIEALVEEFTEKLVVKRLVHRVVDSGIREQMVNGLWQPPRRDQAHYSYFQVNMQAGMTEVYLWWNEE